MRARLQPLLGDASGALADLGVLLPLAAALVQVNGFDAATVLVGVGGLYVASGLYFGTPFPVQPIKAASAIAIARSLSPATLAAAGVLLGAILVVLGATRSADRIARLFSRPIVRGLQFGVGLILLTAAYDLAAGAGGWATYAVAGFVAVVLVAASLRWERFPAALLAVVAGVAYSVVSSAGFPRVEPTLWSPEVAEVFVPDRLWTALVLLVIPQIPLTFGNAVVAVTDLQRLYFGDAARKATPAAVSVSSGVGNMAIGTLGGMPLCHGSSGLTAHYRAGARTFRMNLVIGGVLLLLGLFFGPTAFDLLAFIPAAVLVGLLAFTGLVHAALIRDLAGRDLAVALGMGALGAVTGNLAIALVVGLLVHRPARTRAATPAGRGEK